MPGMTIWEAYEAYRTMPNLRLHQLRVAAVSRTMARALRADHELVTQAGLLHDMGNILKADLHAFPPEFYGEEDLAYWQAVQKDYTDRYGSDEHTATSAIARELSVTKDVIAIIESMGFSKAEAVYESGSLELQIVEYADQRVAPHGITSMEERLAEGFKRHVARVNPGYGSKDAFEKNKQVLEKLEARLCELARISPSSISETSLSGTIEELRDYKLS
jgi:putative nucleotidyltransferase with HDIG domain